MSEEGALEGGVPPWTRPLFGAAAQNKRARAHTHTTDKQRLALGARREILEVWSNRVTPQVSVVKRHGLVKFHCAVK